MNNSNMQSQDPTLDDPFRDVDMAAADDDMRAHSANADVDDVPVNEFAESDAEAPAAKSGKAPLYAGMAVAGAGVLFILYSAAAPLLGIGSASKKSTVSEVEIRREARGDVAKPDVVAAPSPAVEAGQEKMEPKEPVADTQAKMVDAPGAMPATPPRVERSVSPPSGDAKTAFDKPMVADDETRLALISIRDSLAAMDGRMKALEKKVEQGVPQVGQVIPSPVASRSRDGMSAPAVSKPSRSEMAKIERETALNAELDQRANSQGSPIFGYYVQAIYPTEGSFKKAWIANGERVHIVTVGDVFNGVKVTRIDGQSMSVRTDAGSIRSRN